MRIWSRMDAEQGIAALLDHVASIGASDLFGMATEQDVTISGWHLGMRLRTVATVPLEEVEVHEPSQGRIRQDVWKRHLLNGAVFVPAIGRHVGFADQLDRDPLRRGSGNQITRGDSQYLGSWTAWTMAGCRLSS